MLSESSSKGRERGDNNNFSVQSPIKKRRRRRRGGEEEEPVLRTTCDNCTGAKVKCNGDKPCGRCKSKGIHCEFTFKKRCGPKRRKGIDGARGLVCGDGLLAPYARVGRVLGVDDHLRVMVNALNKDEVECVKVFMQNLNSFLPLTTFETVKKAATTPAPEIREGGTGSSDDSQDEELHQLHHARKALLHGTIALGAEFLDKDEASITHAGIARQEIKECFDAAVPEMGAAYLILALYWTHQMDSSKIARYMGLAHQSKEIICPPSPGLVASLTFVSVFLYDAKMVPTIGCRVDPPGPAKKPGSPTFNTTAAYQERVLRILSFVLLSIHNRSYRSQDPAFPTGNWSPKALAEYIREANALLDKAAPSGPNDMSRCVVMVLQAYFLFLSGDRTQAVVVAEKLVDLVADNPLVLHLTIVSSLVGSVRSLLECTNRTIAVERLQSAMEPLSSRAGLTNGGSKIEKELTSTFVAKQRNSGRGGAAAASAAAAAAAAAAAQPSRESVLAKQKAQTSSLNVTAGDYNNPLSRAPVDLLHLEPSPAPRRRALPPSTTATSAPGRGGGGGKRGMDVPSLSSSLMQASMSSSTASLLASSPPRSRAGALARAPTARDSLSSSRDAFQRSPVSLLQLDIGYSPEYVEAMPGAVHIPSTGDSGMPGIVPHSRSDSSSSPAMTKSEVEVEIGSVQGGAAGGIQGLSMDETKFGENRREMMSRLQVQQSFKADAPVSLEQVESNIARLGVSHPNEGDAAINSLVTSMDPDAAAELIAAKGSFS